MEAEALLKALVDVGAKIDNIWSMFIGVQLAVFWMILMIPRPLLFFERLVAFVALGIFSFINGQSLLNSYKLLDALRIELAETTGGALAKHPLLSNYIQSLDYSDRDVLLLMTHGGALFVVGTIIAFQNMIYAAYVRKIAKHTPDSVNKLSSP